MNIRSLFICKIICFCIYTTSLTSCYSSNEKKVETASPEAIETILLVNDFIQKDIKKDSIKIYEKPMDLNYDGCFKLLISKDHAGIFTEFDIEKIAIDNFIWSKNSQRFSKVYTQKFVANLFVGDNWLKFNPTGREGYYVFSKPLFSNDYKTAIMRTKFVCGSRCGGGAIILFKKLQSHWHVVSQHCETIS